MLGNVNEDGYTIFMKDEFEKERRGFNHMGCITHIYIGKTRDEKVDTSSYLKK